VGHTKDFRRRPEASPIEIVDGRNSDFMGNSAFGVEHYPMGAYVGSLRETHEKRREEELSEESLRLADSVG
jgi:hypothetical protein